MCIRRKVFSNNLNNCNFISVELLNISALIVSGYCQMFIKQGVGLKDYRSLVVRALERYSKEPGSSPGGDTCFSH